MKFHRIPQGVLARTFRCAEDYDTYVRLDCWGEGSCFFHSVALLTVVENRVHNQTIVYKLATKNKHYQTYQVALNPKVPFCENFRQVGIQLRQRLGKELECKPALWAQFEKENSVNLNRTDKKQTVRGAIEEFAKVETWADIWTIRYCAWRLGLNLLFVNPNSAQEPIYCGVENFDHGCLTLFIYWSDHVHFEPIVQQAGCDLVRAFGENHAFLKCLRMQYKKACPLDPIGS